MERETPRSPETKKFQENHEGNQDTRGKHPENTGRTAWTHLFDPASSWPRVSTRDDSSSSPPGSSCRPLCFCGCLMGIGCGLLVGGGVCFVLVVLLFDGCVVSVCVCVCVFVCLFAWLGICSRRIALPDLPPSKAVAFFACQKQQRSEKQSEEQHASFKFVIVFKGAESQWPILHL